MITKLQITGKLHYHRKCDFQLSKRKLGYRTLLALTAPIAAATGLRINGNKTKLMRIKNENNAEAGTN